MIVIKGENENKYSFSIGQTVTYNIKEAWDIVEEFRKKLS